MKRNCERVEISGIGYFGAPRQREVYRVAGESKHPALCLMCGLLVCSHSHCCETVIGRGLGLANHLLQARAQRIGLTYIGTYSFFLYIYTVFSFKNFLTSYFACSLAIKTFWVRNIFLRLCKGRLPCFCSGLRMKNRSKNYAVPVRLLRQQSTPFIINFTDAHVAQ